MSYPLKQYGGSGSAWTQNFFLDPDPDLLFWIQQKIKEQINENLLFNFSFQIFSCFFKYCATLASVTIAKMNAVGSFGTSSA